MRLSTMKSRVILGVAAAVLLGSCGDPKADKAQGLSVAPPKITRIEPKSPPLKPLPGRCDNSDACGPSQKCILNRCRKAPCRVDTDRDGDGTIEERTTYTYGGDGRVTEKTVERDGGKRKERIGFTYDARGNVASTAATLNGKPSERTDFVYREDGKLLTKTVTKDGEVASRTELTYDGAGNKTRTAVDANGDGKIDQEETCAYDPRGNLITRENRHQIPGKAFARRAYSYDDSGKMLTEKLDQNGDGLYEETTFYQYDENGNERVREWKSAKPTPSRPDTRVRFVFIRNAYGLVERWDVLGEKDALRSRTLYTYSEGGDLLTKDTVQVTSGKVGPVTERVTYTYDSSGALLKEEKTAGPGGPVKERISYDYGCLGDGPRNIGS